MKALDRYIFAQLAIATVATTVALTLTVWLTQSLRLFDFIVNRGLPAESFLLFAALLIPSFLTIVLPVAAFVSVLFIFNKLSTDSELIVMRACGLSQYSVARPALLLALICTLAMYLITLYVLPLSFRNFKDLQHDIRTNYSSVLLEEGVFTEVEDEVVIYIGSRTPEGQLLDIMVHDQREAEIPVTIVAEVGEILAGETGPVLVLHQGNRQNFDPEQRQLNTLSFERYALQLSEAKSEERTWREAPERYLHEIFRPAQTTDEERYRSILLANGHQRIAMPLYVPAFVMLALAPFLMGEFSRRGYWKRILVTVVCVTVLQVQVLALEDVVANDIDMLPVIYIGAILPNVLLIYLVFWANPQAWKWPLRLRQGRVARAAGV